jgi:hypothetical protein
MNLSLDERTLISLAAVLLAVYAVFSIQQNTAKRSNLLKYSTSILTGSLILFYYFAVKDPSHGIAILLLPFVTIWLRWRRRHTGKPGVSDGIFTLGQIAFCLLYLLTIWIQEG